jgi:hypothetical protein
MIQVLSIGATLRKIERMREVAVGGLAVRRRRKRAWPRCTKTPR